MRIDPLNLFMYAVVGILITVMSLMVLDVTMTIGCDYETNSETEFEVYAIPKANLTEEILVQYLDGDELVTLVFAPGDQNMHVHITDEAEPRLVRNETTKHWPGIISNDSALIEINWHIYLPREG